jgi:predicted RecB family nuclease
MKPTISKSTFLRGSQCKKSLYLHWNQPELKDQVSAMQQAIFSQGTDVGKLAQQLFPGGIDAGIYVPANYAKSIEMTSQLIRDGASVIYEAGFSVNGLHCFVDILVKDLDGWKAYEVKSSTQVKPVNLLDAAFQFHVMTLSGLELADVSLVVLNTAYERNGELDIHQLFKIESVYQRILQLQDKVQQDIEDFFFTLNAPVAPFTDIGPHCSDPYDCDFHGHCWQHVPEYSIFNISRLGGDKKWDLYRMGILRFEDIPTDFNLNDSQWQQVLAELKGETHIDQDAIRKFLDGLNYPLYFLDFESFQPAAPMFDRSRSYQQIVFQYSMHVIDSETSAVKHRSFLAESDGTDPRLPFIQRLIRDIGEHGDIIVFNRAFESARLSELAANFPEYDAAVGRIISRMKDLMVIFQQRYYYVPEMKGSYSIKQVLPAMVKGFSYDNLAIGDGGSASMAFTSSFTETDPEKIRATRENLLDYCKQDTLAMVEIVKVLNQNFTQT